MTVEEGEERGEEKEGGGEGRAERPSSPLTAERVAHRLADAWPGTTLAAAPVPLTGGYWASMVRLELAGQPEGVPAEVVFRVAPDAAMGAKELAVQATLADAGYPTPRVHLRRPPDEALGGAWSVMDFAPGAPPLGGMGALAALARLPHLARHLPHLLADAMVALHGIDPAPVSAAVAEVAPSSAWGVDDLLGHLVDGADALGLSEAAQAITALAARRPPPGPEVVCHGDLHPFNLLVDTAGTVTVLDWTGALVAEPAYDLAFSTLLVAHPPLAAPGPLARVIDRIGARLARALLARYRCQSPERRLGDLTWYRGLHGARILLELAGQQARHGPDAAGHPFRALAPVAARALQAASGVPVVSAGTGARLAL